MNLYLVSVIDVVFSYSSVYVLAESFEKAIEKIKQNRKYHDVVEIKLVAFQRFDEYNPDSLIL